MRHLVSVAFLAIVAAVVVAFSTPPVGATVTAIAILTAGLLLRRRNAPVVAVVEGPNVEETEATQDWVEAVPAGILLLRDDFGVMRVNQALVELADRPRAELEGVSLIRAIRDHNVVQVVREEAGLPREIDLRDGQVVRVTATHLVEAVDGVRHIVAVEDLTALRHAQRARSDLVANASHELRTPVTAALALAETLEEGVDDPEIRGDFQGRLASELARLGTVVEGLLDLSRLETEAEQFEIVVLAPGELLRTAARRIEPLVDESRSIALEIQTEAPVHGDRERVLEVLANLLDNALRVSPEDGVVTLVAAPGDGEVRFEVRDQGPGIYPRDRARVFERFYTGEESRSGTGNSGLGLAIAAHIVTRLGGRIWVGDATPGATLCFTLPTSDGGPTSDGVTARA